MSQKMDFVKIFPKPILVALCAVIILGSIPSAVHANQQVMKQESLSMTLDGYKINLSYRTLTTKLRDSRNYQITFEIIVTSADGTAQNAEATVTINIPNRKSSTELDAITTQSYGFSKYWWHSRLFVRAPGTAYDWVKYDHPDNYETYYPLQWNRIYDLSSYDGSGIVHHHFSQSDINQMLTYGAVTGVLGVLVAIVAAALGFGPPGWVVAAIVALIAAVVSGFGFLWTVFTDYVIKAEKNDGWAWVNPGTYSHWGWWIFWWSAVSFGVSFGAWRDIWFGITFTWPG